MNMKVLGLIGLCSYALLTVSCDSAKAKQEPAVEQYAVMKLTEGEATSQTEYVTEMQSRQVVEIRAKVDGYLDHIYVNEGDNVRKGQPLFKINGDAFIEQVNTAKANIKAAEANVDAAKLEIKKLTPLVEKKIISSFEMESAQSRLKSAEAQAALAKAQLQNAQINLNYTTVTSPVDGVAGMIPYKVGSLVGRSEAKPLTTVAGDGDMFAYFSLNEKDLLVLVRDLEGSSLKEKLTKLPAAELRLADGSVYEHKGKIEPASGMIDPNTGSFLMKGCFPNPEQLLRTGGAGRIILPKHFDRVISIPQRACFEMQDKNMVMVVNQHGKVSSRQVEIGAVSNKQYIITSGLKADEMIVLEGATKLRDDQVIKSIMN